MDLNFNDFEKQDVKFDINKLQKAYKEILQIKIGRSPRLVPISSIMEKNKNLIAGLGYILKEQYSLIDRGSTQSSPA